MNFIRLPVLRHGVMQRHKALLPDEVFGERLETVRALMRDEDVGSLLIYADSVENGPVCWLTAYPCYGYNKKAVTVLSPTEPPLVYNSEPLRNVPIVRPFTCCELVRERKYFPEAVRRAVELAAGKTVGIVGTARIGAGGWKTITESIDEEHRLDLTDAYFERMSMADCAALNIMKQAAFKAAKALKAMQQTLRVGESLWKIAAQADYSIRMDGCEDAGVMADCGKGKLYPSYPMDRRIEKDDTVLLYAAAQYARYWGVAGRSVSMNGEDGSFQSLLSLKEGIRRMRLAGMTLEEARASIWNLAVKEGLTLSEKVPLICGIGMDLQTYPNAAAHVLHKDAVLQIALLTDEPPIGMLADALCIGDAENFWLANID